ncbi:MAG: hypothetical protein IH624_07835 [Phycisphaerae bacterium]|nr:hypothetical protein [Phycisphaerae bacterium]
MSKHQVILTSVLLAQCLALGRFAIAAERRIAVGADMPQFSAVDGAGEVFAYKHGDGKPLIVVFLSAGQERGERAAADVKKLIARMADHGQAFNAVAVLSQPRSAAGDKPAQNGEGTQKPAQDIAVEGLAVLLDDEYHLWGKFGIIATPTVVISGRDDKVLWVEAGYGYDFLPVIEARLRQALGIEGHASADHAGEVRIMTNNTAVSKVQRHLRMAQLLKGKGHDASALRELEKARQIDPNSVEVALEVGRMYCEFGKGGEALKAVADLQVTTKSQKSTIALIRGWASRQAGDLDTAENHLLAAIANDPRSERARFQLGRVYQAKGEFQKAADCYYKALAGIYGDK